MGMRHWVRFALPVALTALAACGTRTVLQPNPQPRTSYEMLIPKTALHYTLAPGQTAVQPQPDRLVPPAYPAALLHANTAPVTVVVQLTVDAHGQVYGVYPVSSTATGAGAALFEAAVESAVRGWKFTPLWMETPQGDGTQRLTTKPFSLWYAFHFKIVDGKPVVETVKR